MQRRVDHYYLRPGQPRETFLPHPDGGRYGQFAGADGHMRIGTAVFGDKTGYIMGEYPIIAGVCRMYEQYAAGNVVVDFIRNG